MPKNIIHSELWIAWSTHLCARVFVLLLPPKPRVPTLERFSGDREKLRALRNACQLYFALQPRPFSLESIKVGFIISLLQGEPQSWAHRMLEENIVQLQTMPTFIDAMAQLYDNPKWTTAEAAIHALQHVMDFRCWNADTQWNDAAR